MRYSIGWYSTGRDEAAGVLLQKVHECTLKGIIPATISYVFSNRAPGEAEESDAFFRLVDSLGLELISFSSRAFQPERRREGRRDPHALEDWRRDYDRQVLKLVRSRRHDLVVLAGYMLIAGEELCRMLPMINLHPALPGGPKGTWQEVIWELIRTRADRTGVMMHRVTDRLDEGPPITFCSFSLRGAVFDPLWKQIEESLKYRSLPDLIEEEGERLPLFREIRRQGVRREIPLLIYTIKALAEGKIALPDAAIDNEDPAPTQPHCLNEQVEAFLNP